MAKALELMRETLFLYNRCKCCNLLAYDKQFYK